jgi:putative ABC transport system permease protein
MDAIRQDVKLAVRALIKRPSFSLMVVVTLALGVGANAAIFTIFNALLLRPLPFEDPERLTVLFERNVIGNEQRIAVAPGNFLDWTRLASSTSRLRQPGP